MDQSFIVISSLPERIYLSSELKVTLLTDSECPVKVYSTLPLCLSKIFIGLSAFPERINLSSELKATLFTQFKCPLKV